MIAVDLLSDDSVLVVFLVIGVAAAIGAIRVRGLSLGPAAALFVGLALGAVDDTVGEVQGLEVLRELGLVLFTYTIGLASGPVFAAGFRRGGVRIVAVTAGLVGALAGMCALAAVVLDLPAADRAGLFAGATTNTPALQAASDALERGDPVIAYSLTYPSAVAAMLVMVTLLLGRRLPLPATLEPPAPPPRSEALINWTVQVTVDDLPDLDTLAARYPGIGFSRVEHDGVVTLALGAHRLHAGDSIVVLGPEPTVRAFCDATGVRSDRHLPFDRSVLDFRRIVVSDRALAGTRLADLDLIRRYGVTVTRIRHGDTDVVARGDTVLHLGDRVRVVGPRDQIPTVARLFGDSERRLSEVDAAGFALGIAAGLALGLLALPLPGGFELQLGVAGGPLVAGLVLGVVSRTGPLTWQLPNAANLVLRQLGILMFLACAGLGSGATFADAIGTRHGVELALAGAVIAAAFAALVPLATQLLLRRDIVDSAGMLAGIETQPAALAYATDRSAGDERVSSAYALVFPVAMIAKIVVVQLLVG